MARALWSGAISFGLVNVPVKMFRATSSTAGRGVSFHQIHAECGTRIQHVRRCPHCEREVPWDEVQKGYEFAKGRYAVLTEADFAGLPKEDKAAIAILDFAEAAEIDPMLYDTTYFLAPDGPPRAYALLHRALEETRKVAIAKVMLRTKAHLAVVRPHEARLVLETMYYSDELADAGDVPGVPDGVSLPPREVEMAEKLIAAMTAPFDHDKYKDDYTEAVQKVIEQKIAGHEVTEPLPLPQHPSGVIDLMEALRRSVEKVRSDEPGDGAEADAEPAEAKTPRRRAAHAKREPAHAKEPATAKARARASHAKSGAASRSHKKAS